MTTTAPGAAVDGEQTRRAARRRPAAPRRPSVLEVVGELLMTLGVLLGLFVVWQLWWTDVVADREQDEIIAGLEWVRTEVPEPAAEPEPEPTDAPEVTAYPLAEAPVLPEPEHGTTFATLQVPRWGPDYLRTISQGTSRRDVLDVLGVGHYQGTAMPGAVGNFAVAGHRVTYGKPFNRVEELQVGDALVVQTPETWYVYRVTEARIVLPADVEVIAPVPGEPGVEPTVATMTLTTCHPMFSARERYIVHAELTSWQPVSDGPPAELAGTTDGSA